MSNRSKKTRITVDKADLDVASLKLFNFAAKAYQIPRGKLLARAMYLAARELRGESTTDYDMKRAQLGAKAEEKTVDPDILLDTERWLEAVDAFPYRK